MHWRGGPSGIAATVLALASAALLPPVQVAAQTAPTRGASDAAEAALLDVCKPAAEQNRSASVFAEHAGYAPQASLPPGLPIIREGAQAWRAPSSTGEVYVISGAIPEPAQRSACMVAIYGDPATGFEDRLTERLTAPDIGFERDAKQSFTTDRYRITHYDDHQDYLVRNVLVARPLVSSADHPSLTITAYRVDYSWLKSVSP